MGSGGPYRDPATPRVSAARRREAMQRQRCRSEEAARMHRLAKLSCQPYWGRTCHPLQVWDGSFGDVPDGAGWRTCPPIIGKVENTNICNQFLKLSTVHPPPICQKRGRGREGGRELREEKINRPMSSLAYQRRNIFDPPKFPPSLATLSLESRRKGSL